MKKLNRNMIIEIYQNDKAQQNYWNKNEKRIQNMGKWNVFVMMTQSEELLQCMFAAV